ncbi:MAG: hypothetical protein A2Y33_09510 [Spirochaetes bacterium GWF1_51_8]|nr:MAG: hypothetical protein A2Y33_09510 [Spirochaetes bacterium GWF1_51_8]
MKKCVTLLSLMFMSLCFVGTVFPDQQKSMQWIGKGLTFQKTDPYRASLEFKKAIESSPQWDYPYILIADLYNKNFCLSEAVRNYEKALKLGLSQKGLEYQVYSELGLLYIKTGEYAKAKDTIKAAQKKKPGKLDQAEADLSLLIETVTMLSNSPFGAIPVLKEVLERHPDWVSVYVHLAAAVGLMGDMNAAVVALKNALKFNPLKCIALADETAGSGKNAFYFIRHPANNGHWELTLSLPAGTYAYRLFLNYRYPDEKAALDPENKEVWEKSPGLFLNTFGIKQNWDKKTFHYLTFPTDPVFISIENKIAVLRLASLTNKYPEPGKYFVNPAVNSKYTTNITMSYYDPNAYAVWAVGTFNQWGKEKGSGNVEEISPKYYWPLHGPDENGVWTITTTADLNFHEYAYLVNEDYYAKDPNVNHLSFKRLTNTQNIIGSANSVMGFEDLYLVDFTFYRKNATTVWLVGDFNYWGGTYYTVKKILPGYYVEMLDPDKDGNWHAPVYLTKGKHIFRFVVNGTSWVVDPKQKTDSQNLSEANNIIIVGEETGNIQANVTNKPVVDPDGKAEVEFSYLNPKAQSVWLVGDFNYWGGKTTDLKELSPDFYYAMTGPDEAGYWKVKTRLPVGAYYYKYVVDGKNLLTDKEKKMVKVQAGASSTYNNVVYIGLETFPKGEYYGMDKDFGVETVFKYTAEAQDITNVWVIGDFNIWGGKYLFKDFIEGYYYPMSKTAVKGEWIVKVKLTPGHYQYRYVLNGKKEITDKNSVLTEKDTYNKAVSAVEVVTE